MSESLQIDSAEALITNVVEAQAAESGSFSAQKLASSVTDAAGVLPENEQQLVSQYVASLGNFTHGEIIKTLPEENVAGLYNGNIFIDTDTVEVPEGGITEAIAHMEETVRHEAYHALHKHLAPITVGGSAEGDIAVTIGEIGFTRTELIEGLTVLDTGNVFVSDEYREFQANLEKGVANSDISMDDVRTAVNKEKDLTKINDHSAANLQLAA